VRAHPYDAAMRAPLALRLSVVLCAGVALAVLAACGGSSAPDPAAGGPTELVAGQLEGAGVAGEDADGAGDAVPTTTTVPVPVGDPVNRFALAVGDCVNRYESLDVTTRVPCDEPHDREVFHTTNHPAPFGDPYPSNKVLQRDGTKACYEQFEAYVGSLYELSALVITVQTPTKENFEDPRTRYRGITCYVQRADRKALVGSVRDSGL
jgi:hypothetical protein